MPIRTPQTEMPLNKLKEKDTYVVRNHMIWLRSSPKNVKDFPFEFDFCFIKISFKYMHLLCCWWISESLQNPKLVYGYHWPYLFYYLRVSIYHQSLHWMETYLEWVTEILFYLLHLYNHTSGSRGGPRGPGPPPTPRFGGPSYTIWRPSVQFKG